MAVLKSKNMLCSQEAEAGATRLINRIRAGNLSPDPYPNNDAVLFKKMAEDYVAYCRFLRSSNGQKLIRKLEEQDAKMSE